MAESKMPASIARPVSVRWNGRTSDLPANERYCTCCGRELSAAHRMLEHDQRNNTYHDFRDVPEDRSQGWFPFGLTCAAKLVEKEFARRASIAKVAPQSGQAQTEASS